MSEYKVIFHIDETHKWKLLLGNVSNLLNALDKKDFEIEVLANSEAVNYYDITKKNETDVHTLEELDQKGVKFVACNNALKGNDIKLKYIIHFVSVVPAGVLELVEKQAEGFAYIKP